MKDYNIPCDFWLELALIYNNGVIDSNINSCKRFIATRVKINFLTITNGSFGKDAEFQYKCIYLN